MRCGPPLLLPRDEPSSLANLLWGTNLEPANLLWGMNLNLKSLEMRFANLFLKQGSPSK
jgi:hypothetical protein